MFVLIIRFTFAFLLFVVLPEYGTWAWHHPFSFPTKCKNFTDLRRGSLMQNESETTTELIIPRHLTNGLEKEIKFDLLYSNVFSDATVHEELCSDPRNITIKLGSSAPDNGGNTTTASVVPPAIQNPERISQENPPEIYFTVDGYLHEKDPELGQNGDRHFYSPDDYCVLSVSDEELILKTCKLDCSADLSTTLLLSKSPGYSPSRVCIPKCCGFDEIPTEISSTSIKCRKLNETETFYFIPYLHLPKPIWFLEDSKDPNEDKYSTPIHPGDLFANRESWNRSHAFGSNVWAWDRLHFYTPPDLTCKNGSFIFEMFKADDVRTSNKKTRNPFRLAVAPGHVQPQYLTRSRTWMKYEMGGVLPNRKFCVDGVDNWGYDILESPVVQRVVMCTDEEINRSLKLFDSLPPLPLQTWIHLGCSIFASILLLITFLTFLGIYKTLNSQEHVILSHCASIAALYIMATLGRLNYLTISSSVAGNTVVEVPEGSQQKALDLRTGTGCLIIAVLHHYFQYTTYFWLTIMNYDIWKRVPVLRMAQKRDVKEMTVYSFMAWGIPALLIAIFVVVDEVHNDPFMEVVVPDYAKEYCTVASWSAGYYVRLPIVILLGLNLILILNRLEKWCTRKCREDGGEVIVLKDRSDSNPDCQPAEEPTFPPTLFAIIWCIHLISWLIDLALWLKLFRNNYDLDWKIELVQYVALLGIPILLFHLYCMNDAVLERVGTRFSALEGLTTKLRNSKLIWQKSFTNGKGQCENPGNEDDTVIIEAR